jgi:hypothetical protein
MVWAALYLRRLKRRSTAAWTRRRAGWNSAATTRVEAATASALHGQVTRGLRVPEQPRPTPAAQQLQPPGLAAGHPGHRIEGLRVHDLRHTAGTSWPTATPPLRSH